MMNLTAIGRANLQKLAKRRFDLAALSASGLAALQKEDFDLPYEET